MRETLETIKSLFTTNHSSLLLQIRLASEECMIVSYTHSSLFSHAVKASLVQMLLFCRVKIDLSVGIFEHGKKVDGKLGENLIKTNRYEVCMEKIPIEKSLPSFGIPSRNFD